MSREQSRPVWTDVTSFSDLKNFIGVHFQSSGTRFYVDTIEEWLPLFPERTHNPQYWQFAGRMILVAAEYQFPGIVGHIGRHNRHHWHRDFMSPVHLLALGTYMSAEIIRQTAKKAEILSYLEEFEPDELTKETVEILLSSWVRPRHQFPDAHQFLAGAALGGRLDAYPVLLPDIPYLRNLASIPITGDRADNITREEFHAQILPLVTRKLFPATDPARVASLFLDDSSW